ncbi:phage tail sheath protein (plasmid) [Bacillus licheniformis]|uniref:hypothetical protein n=1 Tax=Bacillus licheniformis TaxID=1402 RepID=UPI0009B7AD3A|nr:hypothetical protein [Bacillus licheniformis]ARC67425.1 phage tail sheath protein [Bacillus licheniformis]MDE1421855.1 hypothetical protein [Bacillus licheniformis]MEC0475860.1 hypothetical protein [Bacillus licheniformis]RHL11920.1 hypothetical protein DW032_20030 [Bacillus licheniformis]TWJ96559.1 hypothetical protein CHCC20442_1416 [Bacillus licheniformis]
MSTFEQYENLPGVKVSYEDGNLYSGTQSTTAATQSILIIGTAIDGPVGEPVSVNAIGGPKAAEKLFGGMLERKTVYDDGIEKSVKVPHQGTLIRAMWEAIRAGNEDVRLLRVSGRAAKTELPVKDPNSEVLQPLADSLGNQLIAGNITFSKALNMASDLRLVKIEKVEEFEGTDTTAVPYKTFNDATGYQSVDNTPGSETVYFPRDKFRPKNTVKITYKAKKRNYTEVTRNMDGQSDESTLGLLTQDPSMTNYFASEVGNWSDDVKHQVNVYIKDSSGSVNTIPSLNSKGERLYRIGKEDNTVADELNQVITAEEFKQGGIRFTSAYQEEVEKGTYPALDSSVTVTADYFYYNDLEIQESVTQIVPGKEKETFLNHTPESGSLEVYYESSGIKNILKENVDYTIVYPTEPNKKVSIMIKAGIGPVGAKLYAYYKTGENSTQGGRLIVQAKYPGTAYGGIDDIKDYTSVYGVKTTVEYEVNANGTLDIENRVIRFIKPSDKKTTSTDTDLVFRTRELKGITTLREFANYVNSLSNNNIVHLDVPLDYGNIAVTGLLVTDFEVDDVTGKYEYRPINLGEIYDESISGFRLNIDDSKSQNDPNRFPWLGTNGFFNTADLADTKAYYETLGGTYGLVEGTIDEYEPLEQGIYSKLENYAVDIISLADVNANTAIGKYDEEGALVVDTERNFATQLAQHCALVTAKTWETIGTIGIAASPLSGLRDVQQYIDLLTGNLNPSKDIKEFYISRGINPSYSNQHYMYNLATNEQVFNDEGDPIDIGKYVSVVFGPEVGLAHEKLGNYIANGASVYASLISQLNPENATTNKEVSVAGLRYSLSEAQHNQLAGGRYVAFESKLNSNGNRVIVVKDGVTAAAINSDYQRLSTVRITHATVQLIRKVADKFIGLPNGIAQRNSLATEIQSGLDKLKENGVLENFQFSIYSSAKDRVLGNAFITLELVPAYELRKIYTSVALRASL